MTSEQMLDFAKFFVPLVGAVVAWFLNERRKLVAEEYERKERKYEALIETLRGFQEGVSDTAEGRELKARFINELGKCWLYCPDDVIERAYAFLDSATEGGSMGADERGLAAGNLMVAIRRDLLSRKPTRETQLDARAFRILTVK